MDRDEFIITVYGLVCEQDQEIAANQRIHRGGFALALTDEEVLADSIRTIEVCGVRCAVCGEYFKHATDEDIYSYFRTH